MSPIVLEFPERPELYLLFTILGVGAGTFFFWKFGAEEEVPKQLRGDTGRLYYFLILLSATIGAFLPGILEFPFTGRFIFGKSLMSALFFGWISAEVVKSQIGVEESTGEVFAFSLPISLAVSRLGCLFGHCCLGIPLNGPLLLLASGETRFPVPLAESCFHFCCFLALLWSRKYPGLRGLRFRMYVASYCVFRFFTEFYRPHPRIVEGLTLYQLMALLLFSFLVFLQIRQRAGFKLRRNVYASTFLYFLLSLHHSAPRFPDLFRGAWNSSMAGPHA